MLFNTLTQPCCLNTFTASYLECSISHVFFKKLHHPEFSEEHGKKKDCYSFHPIIFNDIVVVNDFESISNINILFIAKWLHNHPNIITNHYTP